MKSLQAELFPMLFYFLLFFADDVFDVVALFVCKGSFKILP